MSSALPAASSSLHRPHDEAPARLSLRETPSVTGRAQRFEIVSRGDFVPGQLDRPTNGSEFPVVLVLGGSDAWSRGIERDLAVARIDLPLLGARQSPKLSDRLASGHASLSRNLPLDADTRALVEEFARQSISDVVRTVEALAAEPGLDASRVALVGIGLGASVGAWTLPFVPSLRACVLAGPVGAFADEGLDPARRIAGADAGNVHCRVYASDDGPSEAAVRTLCDALPGQPTPERPSAPTDPNEVATRDRASILDFVTRAFDR